MTVLLIRSYLVAVAGLGAGAGAGLILAVAFKRLRAWDAWVTVPLLLAAAGAHIALIPQVEMQRQILFGLYGAALLGTVILALARQEIWRTGAVIFPAGSIAAYLYFALPERQADYVGLLVKVVEIAVICSALAGLFAREHGRSARPTTG